MICEVLGCTNRTTDKQKGITFYRFPLDESVKQKWIDILSRDGWSPNPLGKVCSAHFKPTEILKNPSKKPVLAETAVPNILPHLKDENDEISSNPISDIPSIPIDVRMEEVQVIKNDNTFLNRDSRLAVATKANKNETVRSKFSIICELAADMNSIKSKINVHLKTRRTKNCRLRAKIEKLKRFLIEIKEENTNNNSVLASLFENALKEPPDTAIDHQPNSNHLTSGSNQGEPSQAAQQFESAVGVTIKDPFVLHLTDELKKLHPEDFSLIKRDIENILEANNNKFICDEL